MHQITRSCPLFSLSMCSYLSPTALFPTHQPFFLSPVKLNKYFFFYFPRYCLILNCVGFLLSVPRPCLHFSINHVSQRNLSTTKRKHACLWFYEYYFFKHPSGSWLSNAKNNFLMLITFSLEIWTPNIISVTSQGKQSVLLLSCVPFLCKSFTYWVKLFHFNGGSDQFLFIFYSFYSAEVWKLLYFDNLL